jgi:hypothetical protein
MSHLACKACGIGVLKLAAARWLCRALRVRGRARWGHSQSRLSRAEPGKRAARARACRAPASRHRVRCALRTPDPWEGSSGELDFTESLDATVHAMSGGVGVAKWNAACQARLPNQTPSASAAGMKVRPVCRPLATLHRTWSRRRGEVHARKSSAALGGRLVHVKRVDYDVTMGAGWALKRPSDRFFHSALSSGAGG